MKEEAPSRKLPPKSAAATMSTPTKVGNDEILNALLRINNFDSISRESLDIDLSACVTFSADPAAMMSGNSLSSTDFWRMLDESAQNPQLDTTAGSEEGIIVGARDISDEPPSAGGHFTVGVGAVVKPEEAVQPSSFSGTFLRPEPPTALSLFSPLKKVYKALPPATEAAVQRQRKIVKTLSIFESKKARISPPIKLEPPEQLLADSAESFVPATSSASAATMRSAGNKAIIKTISSSATSSSFSLFKLPITTPTATVSISGSNAKTTSTTTTIIARSAPQQTAVAAPTPSAQDSAEEAAAQTAIPVPLYKCLDCDHMLLGEQELGAHESAGHRLLYKCSVCDRQFEQEAGLKKHLKTHRAVETRKDVWKKCPDCGKCLKLGSMWMHRKIHSDNKKYGCDICGQKFVQKINLTHHSRVHTAEKPYECPECQKRFQERSHLQRHQKYHAQTRSYRCEKCGKMYKTERCLKVHNLVHLEQRPFACNVCDKSFISNSKLKQHSNIHTGERPFKCNYCPRDFTNFPNWLKHTRRRHKVDHKTGEQLENIPSYCSKKSTKTAKDKAAAAKTADTTAETGSSVAATAATTTLATITKAESITVTTPKAQAKRKKKAPTTDSPTNQSTVTVLLNTAPPPTPITSTAATTTTTASSLVVVSNGINVAIRTIANTNGNTADVVKAAKVKRERKQLAPKQVQKAPTSRGAQQQQQAAPQPHYQAIKKEPLEPAAIVGVKCIPAEATTFPDLHCLSITSAEELIMEQALEMEECGLYDAPVSTVVDTDNAISSEAAAALHFKIKNEFPSIKEEEFVSLKDVKHRVLCSSLESSPFSSPASIELTTTTTTLAMPGINLPAELRSGASTYFLTTAAPFPLNTNDTLSASAGGTSSTSSAGGTELNSAGAIAAVTVATSAAANNSTITHLSQAHLQLPVSTTQTLINHLYLPMTVRMPLLMQPSNHQALPSVDTLLFSSHAANAAGYFHGKNVPSTAATAQHNLS